MRALHPNPPANTVQPAGTDAAETTAAPTVASSPDAAALIAFVASRDAACPVCSYNLRGLIRPRCPECSAALHLQVGSDNLRLGPWFLGVLSFALALGFDGVATIVMTIGLVLFPPPSKGTLWPWAAALACFIVLAAACGAAVWFLFRRRRAFSRLNPRTQWLIAGGIFGVVFAVHAVFGLMTARI
jgi:hypothetical protein